MKKILIGFIIILLILIGGFYFVTNINKINNLETYNVTFDSDGGTNVDTKTIEENNVVSKPTDPTKDGYTFVEWQLDGNTYDFNSKVTEDITLKAIWNLEEPTCIAKKFTNKYTYVYDSMDECKKNGNDAFNELIDNGEQDVFAYGCEEIVDDCGTKWYGVIFHKWSEDQSEYIFYY